MAGTDTSAPPGRRSDVPDDVAVVCRTDRADRRGVVGVREVGIDDRAVEPAEDSCIGDEVGDRVRRRPLSVRMNGVRDVATVRTSSVSLATRRSKSTVRELSPSVTSNRRPVPADRVSRRDAGRARVGRRGSRLNHFRPAPRRMTA